MLVLVVLISVAVALVSGALLSYASTEMRLNRRNVIRLEAKNAAESALEYGAAELASRFRADKGFSASSLVSAPIGIHADRLDTLFATSSTSPSAVDHSQIRLYVSKPSDVFTRVISRTEDNNAYDPLAGQIVKSRIVRLLAQAPAASSAAGSTIAYATQAFEVRDSKLFNYAIFYNLRMEFHPGANMNISGPVHSNEDFHISSDYTVNFYDTVTSASRMIASGYDDDRSSRVTGINFLTGYDASNSPLVTPIAGHTFAITPTGTQTTYVDSDLAARAPGNEFSDVASQLWRGNLQDRSLGVERQNPPGVLDPVDARKLILPPDPTPRASMTTEQRSIEDQKFSRKAGLYVVVDRVTTGSGGSAVTSPRVTVLTSADDAIAFKASSNRTNWISSNSSKVVTAPSGLITTTRRMRDNREGKVVNMVDIDVGLLRNVVVSGGDAEATKVQNAWTGAVYVEVEDPTRGFTTTSDIPIATGARSAQVAGAGTGTGTATAVRLINGQRLPNRPGANSEAGFSFVTNAPVYVAGHYNANGVLGPEETPDGSERLPDPGWDAGTPTNYADDIEVPALVAGDAINILSQAWVDGTGKPIGDGKESNLDTADNRGRLPVHTEISTVVMGGIVETDSGRADYSGGVENYFRLHEHWGQSGNQKTLRYRGSIVALFTSAYGASEWAFGGSRYTAPTRNWGFHDFLRNDRSPPFTPSIRTFRRLDYRDIPQAEFQTLLADAAYGFTLMNGTVEEDEEEVEAEAE